jgi:hypothetical protein
MDLRKDTQNSRTVNTAIAGTSAIAAVAAIATDALLTLYSCMAAPIRCAIRIPCSSQSLGSLDAAVVR